MAAPLPLDLDLSAWLQPLPPQAVFADPDWCIWCGAPVDGDDGRYYLLYSRWPQALGMAAWVTHSEIACAVAEEPLGPYRHLNVALPERGADHWDGHCTHNPTVIRADGRYYLYYMGNRGDRRTDAGFNWVHRNNQRIGVAVADHPAGPWQRCDEPLIDVTPGGIDSLMCSNPSVTARPDGGYLMVYKTVDTQRPLPFGGPVYHAVALADTPGGPFVKRPSPIFVQAGVDFAAEDPFIWSDGQRYWAVVKDMQGHFTAAGRSLALFCSDDGLDWRLSDHPLVCPTEVRLTDGTVQNLTALERPQVRLVDGEPAALFCAAAFDADYQRTANLAIPLRRPGGGPTA